MLPRRILTLLEKRQNGNCSPAELQELYDWYNASDGEEEAILDALDQNPNFANTLQNDMLSSIHGEMGEDHVLPEESPARMQWGWAKYAAAACVGLLMLFWGLNRKPAAPTGDKEIVVRTGKNETRKVTLPDSSRIWLKPESSVRYLATLGQSSKRELAFIGEGFFEIHHDESKPFTVHTAEVDIKVLGTTFNLRSYAADSLVETALIEGKVRIESPSKPSVTPIELAPNQRATFHKARQLLNLDRAETRVAVTEPAKVKQVPMTFDERPFAEVLGQMEKKFGVEIYMDDNAAARCRFTADLEKENLDDILSMLRLTHGISYVRYQNEVFLHGEICDN